MFEKQTHTELWSVYKFIIKCPQQPGLGPGQSQRPDNIHVVPKMARTWAILWMCVKSADIGCGHSRQQLTPQHHNVCPREFCCTPGTRANAKWAAISEQAFCQVTTHPTPLLSTTVLWTKYHLYHIPISEVSKVRPTKVRQSACWPTKEVAKLGFTPRFVRAKSRCLMTI